MEFDDNEVIWSVVHVPPRVKAAIATIGMVEVVAHVGDESAFEEALSILEKVSPDADAVS